MLSNVTADWLSYIVETENSSLKAQQLPFHSLTMAEQVALLLNNLFFHRFKLELG